MVCIKFVLCDYIIRNISINPQIKRNPQYTQSNTRCRCWQGRGVSSKGEYDFKTPPLTFVQVEFNPKDHLCLCSQITSPSQATK